MFPGGQHVLNSHLGMTFVDTRVNNDLIQSQPSLSHYIIVMLFGLDRHPAHRRGLSRRPHPPPGPTAEAALCAQSLIVRISLTSTRFGAKAASAESAGWPSAIPTATISSAPIPMTSRTSSGYMTRA